MRPILIQKDNSNPKNTARNPGSALGPRARLGRWPWAWLVQGGVFFFLRPILIQKDNPRSPGFAFGPRQAGLVALGKARLRGADW